MLNDWSDRPAPRGRRPYILSAEAAVVVLAGVVLLGLVAGVVEFVRG